MLSFPLHLRDNFCHLHLMNILLGFALGIAIVAPIGPVSLLLISVGIERGRRDGVRAGLGIAGADVVLILAVLAMSNRLAGLDATWQQRVHLILGVAMLGVAAHGLLSSRGMGAVVLRIRHPFRTLLIATLANPMTITVWLGLASAMGAQTGGGTALVLQGIGLIAASVLWHTGLGSLAGAVGPLLGARGTLALQRVSAVAMAGIGVVLIA